MCYCCVSTGKVANVRVLLRFSSYFSRQEFELCFMTSDLFYFPTSGDSLDEIVKAQLSQACEADKKNWLATRIFNK